MAFAFSHEIRRIGGKTMRCFVTSELRKISNSSVLHLPRASGEKAEEIDAERSTSTQQKSTRRLSQSNIPNMKKGSSSKVDLNMRFKYPEMFPDPFMIYRNAIKEKLERRDMLARRSRIFIPEFYVGSVVKVVVSNFHQPDKSSTFLGICISREECGLKANFTLRNVVDNLGVEMRLNLYDPRIQKIEVIRLEKRLDRHLRYLRDAPPEYSTFPLDMKPDIRRSDEVPINRIKVKLNPQPWTEWWHKYDYQGIEDVDQHVTEKKIRIRDRHTKPWEKYDLMKTYRETLPEEEIEDILMEIKEDVEEHEDKNRRRIT